jgi:hypothetical protein
MEMNGQLHAPAVLFPENEPQVPIGYPGVFRFLSVSCSVPDGPKCSPETSNPYACCTVRDLISRPHVTGKLAFCIVVSTWRVRWVGHVARMGAEKLMQNVDRNT